MGVCSVIGGIALFSMVCSDAVPQALADKPPSFSIELARSMINKHRARHGLAPVTIDQRLVSAAKKHSIDMSRTRRVKHKGSDGSYPKDRARRAGYNARLASENVAAGYNNTADVIKGWMGSRGHNENLLRRGARHMGMAFVYLPDKGQETWWTLIMGAPR